MRQVLNSMPSNLAEAYQSSLYRVLAQAPCRANLAMRIFGWVAHAGTRLTPEELRHALVIEGGSSGIDEENFTTLGITLEVCLGLVSVDSQDGTIGLIHVTAYEFFRNLQE
jgi:hypothetical protein